ncbi:GTP pyrophosphokinase family protein [Herbaspirillum huttiense]|uniref:GTP pyrophosphokinase n=1 Tax=Herbaspirillum huttiense TaxID=863372 RepID=UPI0039AFE5F9
MNPQDFSLWFSDHRASFDAWGEFVVATIYSRVRDALGADRIHDFFKVLPTYRVKSVESARAKQVKKSYVDPQRQMTDLVGCRFVVLLTSDIPIVEQCVLDFRGWSSSRDRHYLDEAVERPGEFDYQSVHYLVVNPSDFDYNGRRILEGATCEIQIRSLLQHAYAELVHDNVYKPLGSVPASAKRLIARSMALMEATDEMFCRVVEEIQSVNQDSKAWFSFLDNEYKAITGIEFESLVDEESLFIFENFREIFRAVSPATVGKMVGAQFYRDFIAARCTEDLFQKPISIFILWLAKNRFHDLRNRWSYHGYDEAIAEICAAVGQKWH